MLYLFPKEQYCFYVATGEIRLLLFDNIMRGNAADVGRWVIRVDWGGQTDFGPVAHKSRRAPLCDNRRAT